MIKIRYSSLCFAFHLLSTFVCNGNTVEREIQKIFDLVPDNKHKDESYEKNTDFSSVEGNQFKGSRMCQINVPCKVMGNKPASSLSHCISRLHKPPSECLSPPCNPLTRISNPNVPFGSMKLSVPHSRDGSQYKSCSDGDYQCVNSEKNASLLHSFPVYKPTTNIHTIQETKSLEYGSQRNDHQSPQPKLQLLVERRSKRNLNSNASQSVTIDTVNLPTATPPSEETMDQMAKEVGKSCKVPHTHTFIPYREEIDVALPKDMPCLCPCQCTK